jgi:uncharacterized membrane protein
MNKRVFLTTLLVFSMGLNMLFVGVVVGRHLLGMSPERAHFEWMTQEVSEETRRKLRSTVREHMQESLSVRIKLRKAQHQLRSAVTTDEYVEADVVARLAEVRRASVDLQESMHEQMVKNLRELSPEERSHVLGIVMRQVNKGQGGSRSGHPRRPGEPPHG